MHAFGLLAMFLAVAWEQHSREVIAAAAVIAAIGVIYRSVVRPLVRWGRRLDQGWEAVRTQLMTNNGGSTLKDKIDAIDARTKALEEWRMKQEGEH